MKTNCFIGERRSHVNSDLAVFECSNVWNWIQSVKIIPEGFYFVAGLLPYNMKRMTDIVPNIFVQGYRPHSENGPFASERRSYGALLVGDSGDIKPEKDDICLLEANLYQAVENGCFQLILMNQEWRDLAKVKDFMARLRDERNLLETSGIKKCIYRCNKSRGYYLAGRIYVVWAQLVGEVESAQELTKKVLIVDYNSGLPCVVDFDEGNFSLTE